MLRVCAPNENSIMQKAKDTFLYRILLFLLPLCLLSCSKDENEVTTEMYENLQAGDYSGVENRHAYVDLGLSVKWAACNIGAQQKWGWGSTFEWGFTTPQANVKTGPLPNGIEPYPNQMDGEYDADYDCRLQEWYENFIAKITKDNTLKSEYDAAHVQWGGKWRMPTYKEYWELYTQCKWNYTTINNVEGYLITGPSGNSIFLPTSDVYIDIDDTLGGFYWCSTTGNTDDIGGDFISFSKDYVDFDGSVPINVMNIKPVFK